VTGLPFIARRKKANSRARCGQPRTRRHILTGTMSRQSLHKPLQKVSFPFGSGWWQSQTIERRTWVGEGWAGVKKQWDPMRTCLMCAWSSATNLW
jgi:hypothetical protein